MGEPRSAACPVRAAFEAGASASEAQAFVSRLLEKIEQLAAAVNASQ